MLSAGRPTSSRCPRFPCFFSAFRLDANITGQLQLEIAMENQEYQPAVWTHSEKAILGTSGIVDLSKYLGQGYRLGRGGHLCG